jgi:putative transposase
MNQITAEYGVHASQITNWKKQALEGVNQAFVVSRKSVETDRQVEIDELHRQLGQVIAERDWLKKKIAEFPLSQRKALLDRSGRDLSLRTQCDLLGVNRSGLYYEPVPVSDENLLYMRLLDEQYTEDPTYGVLRMTAHLRRKGYPVNEKRVRRLLRIMGLEAVYQKPDTRRSNPEHSVYPHLLRGVKVMRSFESGPWPACGDGCSAIRRAAVVHRVNANSISQHYGYAGYVRFGRTQGAALYHPPWRHRP